MVDENQSKSSKIAVAVLQIILSALLAYFFHWKIKDLIWSLWLSSLTTGLIYFPLNVGLQLRDIFKQPAVSGFTKLSGVLTCLFIIPFFIVHFGGFHFIHSIFLNVFFPVIPGNMNKALHLDKVGAVIFTVFISYWPFLIIDLGLNWKKIFSTKQVATGPTKK